jgi:type IV secretion system protein VirD4
MQNRKQNAEQSPSAWSQALEAFSTVRHSESNTIFILFATGIITSFFTVGGALWGFRRSYERHDEPRGLLPYLAPLSPVTRRAMILGAVIAAIIWYIVIIIIFNRLEAMRADMATAFVIGLIVWIGGNLLVMSKLFDQFEKWRNDIFIMAAEKQRFGTARFAKDEELADLVQIQSGLYIGGDVYKYGQQGHLLTVAGTRGGKGVNLIVPNLLGKGNYKGSWVVIDPKGENAAITARYQRGTGQNVLVLDPWNLVTTPEDYASYNPLDLLNPDKPDDMIDDVSMIAEMIVPAASGSGAFFADRARSIITGLLVHLMTSAEAEQRSLSRIWSWLRLSPEAWAELVAEMTASDNETVSATGNEIITLMKSAPTYASVMSVALQFTDFLKSPALQRSLAQSSFKVTELSAGTTTLYVVIPADKLKSHYQWLRLVVTTALRSVIRNPRNRVTFLLDEFAALGYLPEIEVALSTYAGYNVTIWAILQNLVQLEDLYGKNWQTFLGNTAVRHFFSVGDNFTADYVSKAMGQTTYMSQSKATGSQVTSRPLLTPDEVRSGSKDNIFTLIEQRAPTFFPKIPYWNMADLAGRWDDNPYITGVFPNRPPSAGL